MRKRGDKVEIESGSEELRPPLLNVAGNIIDVFYFDF
jgi:hypothetical protein